MDLVAIYTAISSERETVVKELLSPGSNEELAFIEFSGCRVFYLNNNK